MAVNDVVVIIVVSGYIEMAAITQTVPWVVVVVVAWVGRIAGISWVAGIDGCWV